MTKTMAIADCLHCKDSKPIKGRGLCQTCFNRSDVRRNYPLKRRETTSPRKPCPECGKVGVMKGRGLCWRCSANPAVREKYPCVPRSDMGRRFAAWRKRMAEIDRAVGIPETIMPERVYAVVRVIQSPFAGKLRVMVAWFPRRSEAESLASDCARHFSCRVERWEQVTRRGNERRTINGKRVKVRGAMRTKPVATYRRGERVRREVAA